jgi:hypothetical protein
MLHITRLEQIKRRGNHIVVLIISYNGHYIHFKEIIIEILFSYKYTTLIEFNLSL